MAKVARLYYERRMKQAAIAEELHISQPRVSRLLKAAYDVGLVRTIVTTPAGVHTEVEDALQEMYGLDEAVVVDGDERPDLVRSALGAAGAAYLEATLLGGDAIGVSSWSAALLEVVEALSPFSPSVATRVVQLVGGNGDSSVQVKANRLLTRLATQTGGQPVFLNSPGIMPSAQDVDMLLRTPSLREAQEVWATLTIVLVGIGAVEPSPLAKQSGNAFPADKLAEFRSLGAVGDICFRFFDANGLMVSPELNRTVVGIGPDMLTRVPRRVGVAGGLHKVPAIRGALRGGWVNVLITDLSAASALLED